MSSESRWVAAETIAVAGAKGERRTVLLVLGAEGMRAVDLEPGGAWLVGRAADAQVLLDEPSISRRHARIAWDGDRLTLQDAGSRNGTFLNESPVGSQPVRIKIGDAIRFGEVPAQLHALSATSGAEADEVRPEAFDRRVHDEAARMMRRPADTSRVVGVVSIATRLSRAVVAGLARRIAEPGLPPLDPFTQRSSKRIDALVTDCSRDEALAIARLLSAAVTERDPGARLGVAVFPGDAPSPDSLAIAADLALRKSAPGLGIAKDAVRVLKVGSREVIVTGPEMTRLWALVERYAALPMPVLVCGETGVGKDAIAEALHHFGPRAERPLVRLNCAAMPESLLESELFGHERGAFSGAAAAKPGLFEHAHGGTLFLDEIGDTSPGLQAKMLRVLEDGRVRRVGALEDRRVDVRVVAATHRDLRVLVAEGRFREDLYYRLGGLVVAVPPLRERRAEIPILAERFAAEAGRAAGRPGVSLTAAALETLSASPWPGNVRELRAVVHRAVVGADGTTIDVGDLFPGAAMANEPVTPGKRARSTEVTPAGIPLVKVLRGVEREEIQAALDACDGNQTRAAEVLGMPRRTLVWRMAKLRIDGARIRRQ